MSKRMADVPKLDMLDGAVAPFCRKLIDRIPVVTLRKGTESELLRRPFALSSNLRAIAGGNDEINASMSAATRRMGTSRLTLARIRFFG